jgi:hypothetical protein
LIQPAYFNDSKWLLYNNRDDNKSSLFIVFYLVSFETISERSVTDVGEVTTVGTESGVIEGCLVGFWMGEELDLCALGYAESGCEKVLELVGDDFYP